MGSLSKRDTIFIVQHAQNELLLESLSGRGYITSSLNYGYVFPSADNYPLDVRLKRVIMTRMKKEKEKQCSIRFPLDLFAWIDAQAKEQKRSFNAQVVWMLQQYVKTQKDTK